MDTQTDFEILEPDAQIDAFHIGSSWDSKTYVSGKIGECTSYWESYSDGEPPEHWGHLEPGIGDKPCNTWIGVPYTTTGDYGGCGCVGEANRRSMAELLEDIDPDEARHVTLHGGYSSCALFVRADIAEIDPDNTIGEAINALCDYPILCEQTWSEVEREWKDQSWEDWARDDYQRELGKLHPDLEDQIDELANDAIDLLWYEHAETSGDELWIDENASETMHCYIDKGAALTPRGALEAMIKAPKD